MNNFIGDIPDKCICDPNSVVSGHCSQCSSPNLCSVCEEEYYNNNGQCISCESQMSKCAICNSSTNCISCLTNFNLIKNPHPTSDVCECDPSSVLSGNCL